MNAKVNETNEKVADFLMELTSRTTIRKHREGDITLKVSLAAYSLAVNGFNGVSLADVLNNFGGIKKYDFSLLWSTLEIQYDTAIIPRDLWEDLITGGNDVPSRTIARGRLLEVLNSSSTKA